METKTIAIADVYVPAKRKRTLDQTKVDQLAESVMEEGLKIPIQVRQDGEKVILVEGLHRLEASRALGDEEIACIYVGAKRY
ncbi:MAG: ParB N-terminal domain-containing protein [Rhodospirillales bacterium]|jgi:sulfiredoxin